MKIKKYKPPTNPNFSQNLDENLKIYLVWPYSYDAISLRHLNATESFFTMKIRVQPLFKASTAWKSLLNYKQFKSESLI